MPGRTLVSLMRDLIAKAAEQVPLFVLPAAPVSRRNNPNLRPETRTVVRDGAAFPMRVYVRRDEPPALLTSNYRGDSMAVEVAPMMSAIAETDSTPRTKSRKRTDQHSEANLNPADYQFDDYVYLGPIPFNPSYPGQAHQYALERARVLKHYKANHDPNGAHPDIGQCDHCGAHILSAFIYEHTPTGKLVSFGEECVRNRLSLSGNAELQAKIIRTQNARARKAQRRDEQAMRVAAETPGLAEAFNLARHTRDNHPSFTTDLLKFDATAENAAELYSQSIDRHRQALADGQFIDVFREVHTLDDMRGKLGKYGSLSDKQIAFALKLGADLQDKLAHEPERLEAIKRARLEATQRPPLAAGKRALTGIILGFKDHVSQYGTTTKMVMELADGNKVYGTAPAAIFEDRSDPDRIQYRTRDALKGARVSLTATVEVSRDDEHFGFFSRPTKASVIEDAPRTGE